MSSLNRSTNSPLRPRTTGASTWKRVPSGSSSSWSTICCGVCLATGSPQTGQCGRPDARPEQAHVVVDFGDGAHRGARVLAGGLLVDGDRRGQALDEVDVGLVHLAQELAGVGGQRFHVAALALGEDGVEGQGGLAGAGQPGENDHGVAGQVQVHVAQVVLARALDDQPGQVVPALDPSAATLMAGTDRFPRSWVRAAADPPAPPASRARRVGSAARRPGFPGSGVPPRGFRLTLIPSTGTSGLLLARTLS